MPKNSRVSIRTGLLKGASGHNLPQEAPQAFAEAVVDVDAHCETCFHIKAITNVKRPTHRVCPECEKILQQDVVAIPKASKPKHVIENRAALELQLNEDDLPELDRAFPPLRKKILLEVK